MFERAHHQYIAQVLSLLDSDLLRAHHCYFGGGTAIALKHGEFRESVDMDFLVSDIAHYRELRLLMSGRAGINAILQPNQQLVSQTRDVRADQYGIRTTLAIADHPIKFEIVLEGRILLESPGDDDRICDVSILTALDLATSKLLANSDRWADAGVFNRDVIDLAMMQPSTNLLKNAIAKAEQAYGAAIQRDLIKAVDHLQNKTGWLERCMTAMTMTDPKAIVWQRIKALKRCCTV
jgi:hypothetical protein